MPTCRQQRPLAFHSPIHPLTHCKPAPSSIALRTTEELAVAWAPPPDPLLRDRHDASSYKVTCLSTSLTCMWPPPPSSLTLHTINRNRTAGDPRC